LTAFIEIYMPGLLPDLPDLKQLALKCPGSGSVGKVFR